MITMLNGRLQFHLTEPLFVVDGYTLSVEAMPIAILQALAKPIGQYVSKEDLYERAWKEPFIANNRADRRIKTGVGLTRSILSDAFGPRSGMLILTSTAPSRSSSIKYSLYDPVYV